MTRNLHLPDTCMWYRLDLDVTGALQPEFLRFVKTASRDVHMYSFVPQQVFCDSWLSRIRFRHGLEFEHVMIFIGQRANPDPIAHVDAPSVPLRTAINWCLGPDHQAMQWFSLPEIIRRPYLDTGYYWNTDRLGNWARFQRPQDQLDEIDHSSWYCSELTLVDHCVIGSQPTLVRIDQPHNIVPQHSDRVAISARFRPLTRPWIDCVGELLPFILPD